MNNSVLTGRESQRIVYTQTQGNDTAHFSTDIGYQQTLISDEPIQKRNSKLTHSPVISPTSNRTHVVPETMEEENELVGTSES